MFGVHKCLNGRAPVYLSNDLQYAGQHRTSMRSASVALLVVPRTWTAIGCFLSLDRESGTVFLLLFTTLTQLRASGNCWKHFCSSDSHGEGGIELVSKW